MEVSILISYSVTERVVLTIPGFDINSSTPEDDFRDGTDW